MTKFVEIPASKNSLSNRRPILGVGINDSPYITQPIINGRKVVCPYYRYWSDMLSRCYNPNFLARRPTYVGCSVSSEWLTFSNFREWMKTQDWKGKQLDKDLLVSGNKQYNKESCIFVSNSINSLLVDCGSAKGKYPTGVSFDKRRGEYLAKRSVNCMTVNIGRFKSDRLAEVAYLIFKSDLTAKIAHEEEASKNLRLKNALLRHAKAFKEKAEKL